MLFKRTCALALSAGLLALAPAAAMACACGCGVFDVSTSGMLPTGEGGTLFTEYDFMNQRKNWHGSSAAPAGNNEDKDIKTSFYTVGAQYMFSRAWGAELDVPFAERHFTTIDEGSGSAVSYDHGSIGDVRLKGIYSGFSADMSSGLVFGLKLPTGDHSAQGFDRDTQIGSGSTDLLLGAYHMGNLSGVWGWFASGQLDQPVLITAGYRPGSEANAVTGIYYEGWSIGAVKVTPLAQLVGSWRLRDRGTAADRDNTGYQRLLVAPGVEASFERLRVYADVGIPAYQHTRGNQLVAPVYFKLNIARSF